jgi:hypothetical protein
LNNTQQDLLDEVFLEKNSIEESNYTEVEVYLILGKLMLKENIVLLEKLFYIKQKSVPDSTLGRVTVYSLKFEKPAFENDILVRRLQVEQSEKSLKLSKSGKLSSK